MSNCPNCGKEVLLGAAFCMECGAKIPQEKKCIRCGKILPFEARFCFVCGQQQDGAPSETGINTNAKMVHGDVIGQKVAGDNVQNKVMGNVINNSFTDETKQVKKCHICGGLYPITQGFFCPQCNEFTCENCYDTKRKLCSICISNNEEKYKSTLKTILQQGAVDFNIRNQLVALQRQLGIDETKAAELESAEKELMSSSLSTYDDINIENATNLFYDKGDLDSAFDVVEPIYKTHPNDERVSSIYLPILIKKDICQARIIVQQSKTENFALYLAELEIALVEGKLDVIEKKLNQAIEKWKCNAISQYYEIMLDIQLWKLSKDERFIDNAKNIAKSNVENLNRLENTFKHKSLLALSEISTSTDSTSDLSSLEYCQRNNLYTALYLDEFHQNEVTVGAMCRVKTIGKALELVKEGGAIFIKPGLYRENITVPKKIKLIGITDSILKKKSSDLPIIAISPDFSCKINESVEISGIVFTNDENIRFDNLENYIRNKNEFKTNFEGSAALTVCDKTSLCNIAFLNVACECIHIASGNVKISMTRFYQCWRGVGVENEGNCNCLIEKSGFVYTEGPIEIADSFSKSNATLNLVDSQIYNCGMPFGFYFPGNLNMKNCEIYDNHDGVGTLKGFRNNIECCRIVNNGQRGLIILSNSNSTITNTTIYGHKNCGIFIENEQGKNSVPIATSNVKIQNCCIHDNGDDGILFDYKLYPGEITSCEIYNHSNLAFCLKGNADYTLGDYENKRKLLKLQNKTYNNGLDDAINDLINGNF